MSRSPEERAELLKALASLLDECEEEVANADEVKASRGRDGTEQAPQGNKYQNTTAPVPVEQHKGPKTSPWQARLPNKK